MKAIVYREYGAADVLHIAEREKPIPARHEVLVRVRATEVTKTDTEMRSFRFPVSWFVVPLRLALGVFRPRRQILGGYFSGVIEEVGADVERHQVGEEIFGTTRLKLGAYGQYIALPQNYTIVRKPANMSFEEAAAVPLGGLNALHFMRKARLTAGTRVLINGAGGSIGIFALQIAKSFGAHVTSVDAAHKEQLLRELGTDEFIDYGSRDFTSEQARYDVVFDMVATSPFLKTLRVLKKHGRYLTGNPTLGKMLGSILISLFSKRNAHFAFADETLEELETLRAMIEAKTVRSVLDSVVTFEGIKEAHHRVETERRTGSVVLSLA